MLLWLNNLDFAGGGLPHGGLAGGEDVAPFYKKRWDELRRLELSKSDKLVKLEEKKKEVIDAEIEPVLSKAKSVATVSATKRKERVYINVAKIEAEILELKRQIADITQREVEMLIDEDEATIAILMGTV